ncbi:5-oxoprolinase subunit B family protein [Allorhizocola rhizosphaerae]|uniref:5-oxoprolinase subunit B family protein n=1 Tax=Allorhizocola rhizosphaerae TaxID=1872709 RepID=UPI000E3C21B7|nr:carboxyltransferase domain-containing protein [Allorhizocola rhizosphaerae]
MQVRRYGWDSLLLEVDDPAAWFRALQASDELECEEIVPGARTVLLRGVARAPDFSNLTVVSAVGEGPEIVVPVSWDGADLEDVARAWGVDDPVEVMRGTVFTVAFCGFAPGFAYLSGLSGSVPRLDSPRTSVPKGSVAVAGTYAGIYPRSSPGGWRLLGRTDVELFDLEREPPALLEPGMRVRFT